MFVCYLHVNGWELKVTATSCIILSHCSVWPPIPNTTMLNAYMHEHYVLRAQSGIVRVYTRAGMRTCESAGDIVRVLPGTLDSGTFSSPKYTSST